MMTKNTEAQATSGKVLIAFGAIFAIGGILLVPLMAFLHLSANETRNWQSTEGRVTANIVRERVHRGKRLGRDRNRSADSRAVEYFPSATYEYQVGSRTFTSSRYGLGQGMPSFRTEEAARAHLNAGFTGGSTVTVHYDPKDPSSAVLTIGSSPVFFYLGLFGVALIAVGMLFVWLGRKTLLAARAVAMGASGNAVAFPAQPTWRGQ